MRGLHHAISVLPRRLNIIYFESGAIRAQARGLRAPVGLEQNTRNQGKCSSPRALQGKEAEPGDTFKFGSGNPP